MENPGSPTSRVVVSYVLVSGVISMIQLLTSADMWSSLTSAKQPRNVFVPAASTIPFNNTPVSSPQSMASTARTVVIRMQQSNLKTLSRIIKTPSNKCDNFIYCDLYLFFAPSQEGEREGAERREEGIRNNPTTALSAVYCIYVLCGIQRQLTQYHVSKP